MRKGLPRLALGLVLMSGVAMSAESKEKFRLIEVPDLEALQKSGITVLDANDEEFREKNGVIPGARLLSSYDRYDVQKELPADRDAPLVFYCSNRL
jgi:hypothetical protein